MGEEKDNESLLSKQELETLKEIAKASKEHLELIEEVREMQKNKKSGKKK